MLEGIKAEVAKDLATSVESIKGSLAKDLEKFKIELQDRLKRQTETLAFRYTKTFTAFEEIGKLPAIDYTYLRRDGERFVEDTQLFGRVVEQATARYDQVREIYERVRPLIDATLLEDTERKIEEAERQSNLLTQALYTNSELPEGIDVVTLLFARREAEESIRIQLSHQVAALTAVVEWRLPFDDRACHGIAHHWLLVTSKVEQLLSSGALINLDASHGLMTDLSFAEIRVDDQA